MDLTSDNPFWLVRDGDIAKYPPLEHDTACEVAVVGGGITGALVAHRLVSAGMETIILDRRGTGRGSTSATTGLLQYEIDTHLTDLGRLIGREPAERAYCLCLGAVHRIERLVAQLDDPCGFERRQSLYLASQAEDVAALQDECAARRRCGIDVQFLTGSTLEDRFEINAPGALLSHHAAQVDAYLLTHRVVASDVARGLRVYDQTEVIRYEEANAGVVLLTRDGVRICANKLIFATGYESESYLKKPVSRLRSTFAIATEPVADLKGWARECLLWESKRPYAYVRTTEDHRVIIGGEDEDFQDPHRRDALIPVKSRRLRARIHRLMPELQARTAYAWAGTFAETSDGLPYIGTPPGFPGAYFALGFGGNGITFSVIAADILSDLCRGQRNPDAHLFRFGR